MAAHHDLLEWMPEAVVVTDRAGTIVFANRRAEMLTGYSRGQLLGRKVEMLVPFGLRRAHVEHRRSFYNRGLARPMGESGSNFGLLRKDGNVVAVDISLGPAGADTVAVIRDVTERSRIEAALEHRALHDPLTDLANRTLFFDRLRQSIYGARRDRHQVALVMLDVDGFKAINDRYGHAVGDAVLKAIGLRLREGMRATDTAARIGGDEFAWILPGVNSRVGVRRMVKKRLAAVETPLPIGSKKLDVRLSAGIAMYPEDARDADALMRHADVAMYGDKRARR